LIRLPILGWEHIPSSGPALLVSIHPTDAKRLAADILETALDSILLHRILIRRPADVKANTRSFGFPGRAPWPRSSDADESQRFVFVGITQGNALAMYQAGSRAWREN
jgi:hypothetical protein